LGAAGRCVILDFGRHRFPVVAHARLSLVLSAVQKDCGLRPVSSQEVPVRHHRAGGVFLSDLRELEHHANFGLALS
jgi:hypothetical protein